MTKKEFINKLLSDSDHVTIKRDGQKKFYPREDHKDNWHKIGDYILREFQGVSLTKNYKTYTPMFELFNTEGEIKYARRTKNSHHYQGNHFSSTYNLVITIRKEGFIHE